MNPLAAWIHRPVVEGLGWALAHFLWEGAVIALILGLVLVVCRSARVRYGAACAAMLAMLGAFAVTWAVSIPYQQPVVLPRHALLSAAPVSAGAALAVREPAKPGIVERAIPWAAPIWMAGALLMGLYRLGGWMAARRLRRKGVCAAPPEWQARLAELARRVGVARPVMLLESCLADAPLMIGLIRPVILVPAGLLAGLPPDLLETILLHELAHIRRLDYLANLLQTLVESLLFYHPAVWWVSKVVRAEREHCCDDAVVALDGDARAYAKALVTLEEHRSAVRQPALAATGGNLMHRIRRLLNPQEPPRAAAALLLSIGFLLALFCFFAAARESQEQPVAEAVQPKAVQQGYGGGCGNCGWNGGPSRKAATPLVAQAQPQSETRKEQPDAAGEFKKQTGDLQKEADGLRKEADGLQKQQDAQLRKEADILRKEADKLGIEADKLRKEYGAGFRKKADDLRKAADDLPTSGSLDEARKQMDEARKQLDDLRASGLLNEVRKQVDEVRKHLDELRESGGLLAQAQPLSEKQKQARAAALKKELETPYRKWLSEDVAYIITDAERYAFSKLETDAQREQFIEQFWIKRDPTPGTVENEFKEEHYRRIAYANEHFGWAGIPGWKSDRGRIHIMHGPPDEIEDHSSGGAYTRPPEQGGGQTSTVPFQQWRYRYIEGVGNNVIIEFVDPNRTGEFHQTRDPHEKDIKLVPPPEPAKK